MEMEEMIKVINEHCEGKSCRSDECKIRDICTPIAGRFRYNPDKAKEAYDILKPDSAVDHPSHYNQGGIECIDAMVSAFGKEAVSNFCICNAFKYVWRTKQKNGIEDVDKAVWYLTKYKELISDEAV